MPPEPSTAAAVPPRAAVHGVQLFDQPDSLARTVAAFLLEGWQAGDTLLVVATGAHWTAIRDRLVAAGLPVAAAIDSGRLTVRDARQALDAFRRNERLDPLRFYGTIGQLVRALVARGPRLRVFGEMVDLLAGAGHFGCAEQLEALWNGLAARRPFTLMCGYSAVTFGDPLSLESLRRICQAHQRVHTDPDDLLGSFLVGRACQA
jgi:hypothetical protein